MSKPAATPTPAASGAIVLDASHSAISFERIAAFPPPGWQVPRMARVSPDGELTTYLQAESAGERMALWAFDHKTGAHRVLLRAADLGGENPVSRDEELRQERQRTRIAGITSYAWAARAMALIVSAGDRAFLRDEAGRIEPLEGAVIDPKLCADGKRVAFARGRELWLHEAGGAGEASRARPLTQGAPAGVTRGQSDFNMQEELYEPSGVWWSPRCDRLAYLEVDERQVGQVPILGYRGGSADLQQLRYPRAGGRNPLVRLGIIDLAGKTTWVEMPPSAGFDPRDQYLGRLHFSLDGSALFFQRLSRDQRRLELVRVDAATGKAEALLSHSDPAWEALTDERPVGPGRLVVSWPKDGHLHLALVDAHSGAVVDQLTSGDWDVFRLAGVSSDGGRALFIANRDAVLDRQLYSVQLRDGAIERLTREPGVHEIEGDAERGWVDVHSANDRLPQAVLADATGADIGRILVPKDADFDALGLRPAELVTIAAGGGVPQLFGALLTPRAMRPGVRYPAVVVVYGGPGVQSVLNEYNPRLLWQHLADRGFVVFQLDNRGSSGRGHAFESPIRGRLGEVELADQLRGLDWLEKQPFVDPARVGIYGHSYGGTMALAAMLRAPGRFKVGVAGSPVTDWRLYDTGYTERYLGTPFDNAAGYDASALAPSAKNLAGKLLVIHALMDENVHFQHTAALIDALVAADKDFDLLVFPGERHGYRSPAARKYAYRRIVEYFAKNL